MVGSGARRGWARVGDGSFRSRLLSGIDLIVSDPSDTVSVMEQNMNNPEARDEQAWLRQQDRLGNDAAAAMEQSLASPEDATLPEWGE